MPLLKGRQRAKSDMESCSAKLDRLLFASDNGGTGCPLTPLSQKSKIKPFKRRGKAHRSSEVLGRISCRGFAPFQCHRTANSFAHPAHTLNALTLVRVVR